MKISGQLTFVTWIIAFLILIVTYNTLPLIGAMVSGSCTSSTTLPDTVKSLCALTPFFWVLGPVIIFLAYARPIRQTSQ